MKKEYVYPSMAVIELTLQSLLLAGSPNAAHDIVSDSEELTREPLDFEL